METGKPLVSVVVPVYNAEKYLCDCANSLAAQNYSPLEIILVDDGSTDGSGDVCDSYALRNECLRVIHQKNLGVSAARNAGVRAATGDYIAFVDADDSVDREYIGTLVALCEGGQAELAVCGCNVGRECTGAESLRVMLYQKEFDTAPWGKLFHAELARSVPFPEGMFFEDLAVVCRMVGAAKRAVLTEYDGYHYRATPEGTMNGGNINRLLDEIRAADMMVDYVTSTFPDLAPAAQCRRFSACCQVLLKLPEKAYQAERKKLWEIIRKSRGEVLRNRDARCKNRAAAALTYCGEGVMRRLWKRKMH